MTNGHFATSPWQMPSAAWKDIAKRTWQRTWDDNVALVAAGVAFYGFFALVSLIGIIVLAYGLVAEPRTVVDHVRAMTAVLPTDVALIIGEQALNAVKTSEGAKGAGLIVALLAALYGGTNGSAALITALNIAYEEKEKRSLLRFYLLAVLMTLSAVVVTLAAIAATAAIATISVRFGAGLLPLAAKAIAYILLLLVAAGLISALYRYAPSRERAKWVWITPGCVFAAAVWLLLTVLFGFYVSNLTNFSATYGSLGALAAFQTWLYLSAYVLVMGAELNSEIEHQTARDSTTGPEQPLGQRGAWAADNVATSDEVEDRPEEAREGEKLTQASATVADRDSLTDTTEAKP
ncbi:YihY/virulence factor BrkB family protein [Sphingomonas piscis]|uniref:YihY/virulence factor BrkB family protein n=1 Tax=Sphingomonas piscis TaxID=2714943 RepID=A0A6G7YS63_9SPHN|nr:YihY/virulence factor BrkB family protein [Sphingomonas piscis]QIK79585.1 YihY/virulence factor BrkB family protein [Sphingomonas piscis]